MYEFLIMLDKLIHQSQGAFLPPEYLVYANDTFVYFRNLNAGLLQVVENFYMIRSGKTFIKQRGV